MNDGCLSLTKRFPGNPVGKQREHGFLSRPNRTFPGATESEKVVLFSRSCFICSNPSLISVSGFRGGLSVKGIDLCKW